MQLAIALSDRVRAALAEGRPAVALETAVLTHGLPRPLNLEVFREMEAAVAAEAVVPAAVALVGGKLRVGLAAGEIEALAGGEGVCKAGISDLPALAAADANAGTTVAATLWASRAAGIAVFATGGIGGVHRGVEKSWDVSGDLMALSRWGGCVVCSGSKAVLDVPKTLQALESLGVCVLGYRTLRFPAFVCSDSGLLLKHRVDDPAQVARVVRGRNALGLSASVLVANPPPGELSVSREVLEGEVSRAVEEANRQGVWGSDVTPFLLRHLAETSAGTTLEANRALLVANARLGAQVARELCR